MVNWNESIPVEQFEMKVDHLDIQKKKIIYDLVEKYSSTFAKDQYDMGAVKGYEAHIKLLENKYVAKKKKPINVHMRTSRKSRDRLQNF